MLETIVKDLGLTLSHTWTLVPICLFLGQGLYTDLKEHKLYKVVSYIFIGLRLLVWPWCPVTLSHLYGLLIAFGVRFAFSFITRTNQAGDLFFMTALGFWLGMWGTILVMAGSSVLFIIVYIVRNARNVAKLVNAADSMVYNIKKGSALDLDEKKMPLGPFMVAMTVLVIAFYYAASARMGLR